MSNIYAKSMSKALQEARDYRDVSNIEEGKGFLEYDEWLKQVKGIAKGAYGINSDEHAKYSGEWRDYVKGLFGKLPPAKINAHHSESNLEEIVGGHGDMTITKDGGVMIIKTREWQTYKAKGWVKREEVENESLDLSATGDTITSNASQEVEGEELNEAWSEKLSIKALEQFRTFYATLVKAQLGNSAVYKEFEKAYDDLAIGKMFTSRYAEKIKLKKLDGRSTYKNANW